MNTKKPQNDLASEMLIKLACQNEGSSIDSLDKAVDCLNSAIDILEDAGQFKQADRILAILEKIAKEHHPMRPKPRDPRGTHDKHAPKSPDEMIKNLLDHGTMFNLVDDGNASDDSFDADVPETLEITEKDIPKESQTVFEDE